MRRALGLDRETPLVSQPKHSPNPSSGLHQRRHFVRDGDVPVSVVHSDGGSRLQQLDAARQALRQQTAAREEAERLLADARNTIHDLETKFGHERLARDEVTQRTNAARQQIEETLAAIQEELAAERALRARGEGTRRGGRCHANRRTAAATADGGQSCATAPSALPQRPSAPAAARAPSEGRAAGCCLRRFRDRGMVVARVAGEVSVESYVARGGSRIARPTTATSSATATMNTISIGRHPECHHKTGCRRRLFFVARHCCSAISAGRPRSCEVMLGSRLKALGLSPVRRVTFGSTTAQVKMGCGPGDHLR
jgi:hypothetical protein